MRKYLKSKKKTLMEKRKIYREFFKFIKIIEYKYFDRMSFRIIKYLEGY